MKNTFTIWVDADAFPNAAKEILFRAGKRTQTPITLVANKVLRTPPSPIITSVLVPAGDDVADHYIVEHMSNNDLVITGDIPLAAEVLEKNCQALNPRGQLYTKENIADRLSMRDFMDNLRANGLETGGPPPLTKKDQQTFANALDRILTKSLKQ
ncbi:YaiI/YqxD family protein [Desulforhopalus sp. 52FAK]